MVELESLRLIKRAEVERLTCLSRASIYSQMLIGEFPRPVQTGARAVAWRERDVREWLESRPVSTGWQ